MIRYPDEVESIDRAYARDRLARMSYHEALAIFAALWTHAARLNPGFPGDWREDIASDLELARVLNGLPSDS